MWHLGIPKSRLPKDFFGEPIVFGHSPIEQQKARKKNMNSSNLAKSKKKKTSKIVMYSGQKAKGVFFKFSDLECQNPYYQRRFFSGP